MPLPEEQASPTPPVDGDPGSSSSSSSASSAGSSSASSVGSSSSAGSASSSGSAAPRASDSRRVAPKWLGKKIGRFRLQGMLGQGAVGRVFRAEDAILHRRVALKVIALHSPDGQVNRNADQFLTEARAAAALEHPNVVQIYEAGESGNLCYIAMELLDGGNLKDLVVAAGPMDPGRACMLTADAADALAAGHEAGIIHRDIKPANLMLSRQGRCKVTDFGLATFGDADSVSREKAAGTPLFAAPEVIRGTSADERSDIYSLGATLYYLLTGRPPFTAKTRQEVLRKHVNEPVPDLRVVRPGLPESLVAAVERALDKDPGQRFGSATQFARVLRVQTIPVSPMPMAAPMYAGGETLSGASFLGLSGLTAATGSTGGLGGSAAAGGSGQLTAADVATATRRPPSTPAPSGAPAAPTPARPTAWAGLPGWRTVDRRIAGTVVGGAALVLIAALVFRHSKPAAAPPVPQATTATPAVPPPVATPPPVSPVEVPPPALSGHELRPTDVERLTQIAEGTVDVPDHRATVVGRITTAALSPTGKTVRLEFTGTPFAVVYFDTENLYGRMAQRFGPNAADLPGRTVRVVARVKMYGKVPEMVVTSPDQITVVDKP